MKYILTYEGFENQKSFNYSTHYNFSNSYSINESSSGDLETKIDNSIGYLKVAMETFHYHVGELALSILHALSYFVRGLLNSDLGQKVGYFATGFLTLVIDLLPGPIAQKIKGLKDMKSLISTVVRNLISKFTIDKVFSFVSGVIKEVCGHFMHDLVKNIPSGQAIKDKINEFFSWDFVKIALGDIIDDIKKYVGQITDTYQKIINGISQLATTSVNSAR